MQLVSESNKLLDNIFCSSIHTFRLIFDANLHHSSIFTSRHNQLKDIFSKRIDTQSLEQLSRMKLTNLSIPSYSIKAPQAVKIIEKQPQLTSLTVFRRVHADVLRQILKLQHLESLKIRIDEDVPEQLVRDIMQMPKLMELDLRMSSGENVVNAMLTVKNLQLEHCQFAL